MALDPRTHALFVVAPLGTSSGDAVFTLNGETFADSLRRCAPVLRLAGRDGEVLEHPVRSLSDMRTQRVAQVLGPAQGSNQAGVDGVAITDVFDAVPSHTPRARSAPQQAVDAFMSGVRRTERPSRPHTGPGLERARQAMASSQPSQVESTWRGLRLLARECTANSGLAVAVLEADNVATALERLDAHWPDSAPRTPWAVVVACEPSSEQDLTDLCEWGAQRMQPILVGMGPELAGRDTLQDLHLAMSPRGDFADAWSTLRKQPGGRWLFPTINRVVSHQEELDPGVRTVLSNSVLLAACTVAHSLRTRGGLSVVTGPHNAFDVPAAHEVRTEDGRVLSLPTESYIPARDQVLWNGLGVGAAGSARNSARVIWNRLPAISANADAWDLQGQACAGRATRVLNWLLASIPPGTDRNSVLSLVRDGIQAFVFPHGAGTGEALCTQDGTNLRVELRFTRALAGTPRELSLELPVP